MTTTNSIKYSKLGNESELIHYNEQRIDQAMKDYFAEQEKTKNQTSKVSKGKSGLVSMLKPLALAGAIGLSAILTGCGEPAKSYEGDVVLKNTCYGPISIHYKQEGKTITYKNVEFQDFTSEGADEGEYLLSFDLETKLQRGYREPVVVAGGNLYGLEKGCKYDVSVAEGGFFQGKKILQVNPVRCEQKIK